MIVCYTYGQMDRWTYTLSTPLHQLSFERQLQVQEAIKVLNEFNQQGKDGSE